MTENGVKIDRAACTLCGICTDVCPETALTIVGREMSPQEVADTVERDKVFYETSGGGVTLSGGDPTLQCEFAAQVLQECRDRGVHIAVETGMFCGWDAIKQMLPHTDLFLLDLKIMDPSEHKVWTGQDNSLIKENFEKLCREPVAKTVRVALIPEMTAAEDNVRAISEYVSSVDKSVPIELLNFNPLCRSKYEKLGRAFPLSKSGGFSEGEMDSLRKVVRSSGCQSYPA